MMCSAVVDVVVIIIVVITALDRRS